MKKGWEVRKRVKKGAGDKASHMCIRVSSDAVSPVYVFGLNLSPRSSFSFALSSAGAPFTKAALGRVKK